MFRDELTGREIWRISDYTTFHEYCHASHPFSYDGRRIACRCHRGRAIVVFDLRDGSETVFGEQHPGTKMRPCFVRGRGRRGVVYSAVGSTGGAVFLHWLDTGEEREIMALPKGVTTPCAGVIGPRSEYVLLRGDLNGDGLSDWSLKSLWTDDAPRIVWTSPTTAAYPNTASPCPAGNRLDFSTQICHPEIIRRAKSGEPMNEYKLWTDSKFKAYIAVLDLANCAVKTFPAKGAGRWAHEAWSGDGEFLHMGGYSWRAGANAPSIPIRIAGHKKNSNHYGTCGRSGRYVAGDSGIDGMERLELTDLWTGEMHTVAHISTPTRPAGKIAQDHGHPAGSPDGTKVLVHSCYDLVNHRLYAIPTKDVPAGAGTIPVETTEGFAPRGTLLIRHGYTANDMTVSYQRTDATHFYGCSWGDDAATRLKKALRSEVIAKGAHVITDLAGRVHADGSLRPRKEYIVVVKQPDPPRALVAARSAQGVRLGWLTPRSCEETAGYAVYRRRGGGTLQRLTPKPVPACEFIDRNAPHADKTRYWVRAVEHSGLHGDYSGSAWVDGPVAGVELLDSYDVRGCNFIEPGKRPTADAREVRIRVPLAGKYVLWGRCRAWRKPEALRISIDGKRGPDAQISDRDWNWVRLCEHQFTAGEHTISFARDVRYDITDGNMLRNSGFEDGLDGWDVDQTVASIDTSRAHSGNQCLKLSGMLTRKKVLQEIGLKPKSEWNYRLSFWLRGKFTKSEAKRYHGPHPNTLGRIAVNLEPFPYPRGWTCDGNEFDDTQWHHIEVVVSSPADPRWKSSRAQPFWCPWYWGEQVGTLWIDDVEVVELGPRLRPAKITKLLVTNVPNYRPTGRDGRASHAFPRLQTTAVTELRQTGSTRNTVRLAWDAPAPAPRGCNVYARVGDRCPVTKYSLVNSVWSGTTTTLRGLTGDTEYTVKVAPLNDDGNEGPPASLTARTAAGAAEACTMEAEQAELTPPLRTQTADGVTYVVTPADPDRDALYDREGTGKQTGTARFEFLIKASGQYRILGRTFAPNGASNSFWFSLDGQPETCWDLPNATFGTWAWTAPVNGKLWKLAPGTHTITLRTREAGTRIDRLVLTNDLAGATAQTDGN